MSTPNVSRATEIRAELDNLAPYPADDAVVTARGLARWLAMESQLAWARMTGMDHPITMTDVGIVQGYFAAAHALLKLAEVDEAAADKAAGQIRDAFGDGGSIGEWLWGHHGGHAKAIGALADELAWVTAPPAAPEGVTVPAAHAHDSDHAADTCPICFPNAEPAVKPGVTVDPEDLRVLMRLAEGYAARDPLHLPPNDSCRAALDRLAAAVKP